MVCLLCTRWPEWLQRCWLNAHASPLCWCRPHTSPPSTWTLQCRRHSCECSVTRTSSGSLSEAPLLSLLRAPVWGLPSHFYMEVILRSTAKAAVQRTPSPHPSPTPASLAVRDLFSLLFPEWWIDVAGPLPFCFRCHLPWVI